MTRKYLDPRHTQELNIDPYTGALGIIEQEHLKIHEGRAFTVSKRVTIDDTGGSTPTREFLIVVPAGVFPHFRKLNVSADSGPFDIDFYEDAPVSANGTAVAANNNNRNSDNTAETLIFDGPTITTDGDILETVLVPGTKQAGALGSEGSNEWDLDADSKYMLRITNNTAGAGSSIFTINMFFYE